MVLTCENYYAFREMTLISGVKINSNSRMDRMNKLKIVLIFFLAVFAGLAQNTEWTVASSSVKFRIKNAGFMVDGEFGGLEAKSSSGGNCRTDSGH